MRLSFSINTGSSALSCGLVAALAAVAFVIGITRFDLTRPADHASAPKLHTPVDHAS